MSTLCFNKDNFFEFHQMFIIDLSLDFQDNITYYLLEWVWKWEIPSIWKRVLDLQPVSFYNNITQHIAHLNKIIYITRTTITTINSMKTSPLCNCTV